jgi:hypothetical protein
VAALNFFKMLLRLMKNTRKSISRVKSKILLAFLCYLLRFGYHKQPGAVQIIMIKIGWIAADVLLGKFSCMACNLQILHKKLVVGNIIKIMPTKQKPGV